MPAYDFSASSTVKTPSGRSETMKAVLDLKGLDMITPVDQLNNGRTPYAKNFRLYAQQSDDRRVAVSSRKGPGYYITPLGETLSNSQDSAVGASTAEVGVTIGQHLTPVTAANSGRISRVDIKVGNTFKGTGPLRVQLYSDIDGVASVLLTESSILNGDISENPDWVTARFLKPLAVTAGFKYWIVLSQQDDGTNSYTLPTTTAGVKAYKTDSTLPAATEQTYGVNFKVYLTDDITDKNAYRFNRDNGENITLVVYGSTMYRVQESDHSLVKVIDGLNPLATEYNYTNADNKVFWVNGLDELTAWEGTDELTAVNLVTNPSFTTDASGWAPLSGSTIVRATASFNTAPASLAVTRASLDRGAEYNIALKSSRRYKMRISYNLITSGANIAVQTLGGTAVNISNATDTPGWKTREFYFTPANDRTGIRVTSSTSDFFLDDVSIIDTGIDYITSPNLPILSDVIFHKDRAWGVTAADRNKLVFSENPGNPAFNSNGTVPTTATQQWYYAWLSVSFIYVPRPHNGSPITGIVSFQDALTVFTQDKKYVISGYDRGSLNLRESTGSKGALSRRGITADENRIYFVANDGLYEHNGSSDTKLSEAINPLFDACGQKEKITPVIWKNEVRFYMASQGSAVNDICAIWNKDIKEWQLDTDTYVNHAIYYNDADDNQQLIEFNSLSPVAYTAEQEYNSVGAPIDFEYRLNYDSMGAPGQRKRVKRYYPLLQGVDSTFKIQLAMDKDFQDSPRIKDVLMATNGSKLGSFKLGDGTSLGGDKSFKQHRQSYSGYAYYWQLRVMRNGVNNRVAFIGAQFSYKSKRL